MSSRKSISSTSTANSFKKSSSSILHLRTSRTLKRRYRCSHRRILCWTIRSFPRTFTWKMIRSYGNNSKTITSYSRHNMHFPPTVLNSSSIKTLNQSLQETTLNEIFLNCKVSSHWSNLIFQFRSLLKITATGNHPEEQITTTIIIIILLVKWNHDISNNINWNISPMRSTQMI